MYEWLLVIRGVRFDYVLCSVFANDMNEAERRAKREVEPREEWYLIKK